ncbi:MAG: serine hydrolase [Clostridiales bacterium]|nr:serine hydrolase [Clostridiales bacterium]
MKKTTHKSIYLLLVFTLFLQLTGCASKENELYGHYASSDNVVNTDIGEYVIGKTSALLTENKLCYISSDELVEDENIKCKAALLIDVTNNRLIQGQDIYKKIYPASLTKLLTAYVVLKNGNMEEEYTIKQDNCGIYEAGAQLIGFKKGDVVKVSDLLYCLLVYSGNDSAVALADYISGGEDKFCELMNEEAKKLGLSGTHFTNSHGLHDTEHYTTAYDMYILLNKCMENEMFRKVSQTVDYEFSIRHENGEYTNKSLSTTNRFKKGLCEVPEGLTILGGKTGNTLAAGPCLIQYFSDSDGNEYIAAIFGAENIPVLYEKMTYLMNKVNKSASTDATDNDNKDNKADE